MNRSKFEPIDADNLNQKAKVLLGRSETSFLGYSRAAVTQHYIDVKDNEERKLGKPSRPQGLRGWAASMAKAMSF